jgi:diguanylate cyclase (GGDEF)-like protein
MDVGEKRQIDYPAGKHNKAVSMSDIQSSTQLSKKMSRLLMAGFAVLLGLMALLTYSAVSHMQDQEGRMRDIVEVRNRKIELATMLLQATHNRHNSLVYQVMVDDPFARDEHFQSYIKWGYTVGKARNDLRTMPLDAFETENLRQQDELVPGIIGLHEAISDLASQGWVDSARELIAVNLRPYNLQFISMVEALQAHERTQIQRALAETRQSTRQAVLIDMALGIFLTVLACLIAVFTYRQLNRYAGTIHAQMIALAQTGVRLEHEATHDHLTGLANRSLFQRRLEDALQHAGEEDFLLGVMYLDLDEFKPVNDRHGHSVGDALLREVANRLRQVVRASDTVARLGGDEFAIVLVGLDSPDQCPALGGKIARELARSVVLEGVEVTPAASIGCVLYPEHGRTVDELLKAADDRMYEVKRARKENDICAAAAAAES